MSTSVPSKQVLLHPLCLASICDHYTRIVVGGTKLPPDSPVLGIILGKQDADTITFFDVSEAIFDVSNISGDVEFKFADINRIVSLRTAVYTTYEVVGWYAVGTDVLPLHMSLHKQIEMNLVQNPLFLLLNPSILSIESKLLPIRIFETVQSLVQGSNDQSTLFVDASFRLETGQVEKLAVDEVTKAASGDVSSALELQNQAMTSSVLTLGEKIYTIIKILKGMQSGAIPSDPSLLRRASKIVRYLHTTMAGKELDSTLIDQIDECYMIAYLSSATKAAAHICEIADMYSMVYAEQLLGAHV